MPRHRSYTDIQFLEAVRSSRSIAETLRKLNIKLTGGNYTHFKIVASKLNVNYSHFDGKADPAILKHKRTTIPLESILVANSTYNRGHLKRRLLQSGILVDSCSICNLTKWQGQCLVLHMDHINGDPLDNRIENLRLLCPNCHSQTSTYAGRNKNESKQTNKCIDCNVTISIQATRCRSCAAKLRNETKIDWPTTKHLRSLISACGYLETARKLGVSDNAIRKRMHNHP